MILSIPTKAQETYIKMCHEVWNAKTGIEYALLNAKATSYGRAISDICGTTIYGEILMAADRSFPVDVDTCGGIPFTFKKSK